MAYRWGNGAVVRRAEEDRWWPPTAAPSIVPWLSDEQRGPALHHGGAPRPRRCLEIDCVRHFVPPAILAIAEQRAMEADVGADQVLIAWGVISEEAYVAALATSLD